MLKSLFLHLSPLPTLGLFVPGRDVVRVTLEELMAQNIILFPHTSQETRAKSEVRVSAGLQEVSRADPYLKF